MPKSKTAPATGALNLHLLTLRFDLFERVELALAAAGADLTGMRPVLGRTQIRVPERPGATLSRASVVDGAASSLVVEKDAYLANLEEEKLIAVEGSLLGYGKYHDKDNKFVFKKARRLPEHFQQSIKFRKFKTKIL